MREIDFLTIRRLHNGDETRRSDLKITRREVKVLCQAREKLP